ncbi:hypothetical protein [Bifidobacterium sp. ESL0790]|uniref:hypothetical protein n=1 Tax=Bifidobacterium sp. ESL0790 TaxID=2983233 RepID=UPI0023F62987|nr:hypothetical protein [Bifidobacterium sp. ESL0790]WEV72927.1 hypothetical protein OZY47_02950 [Bifidobacterium sp. ESL0790]
MTLDTATSPFGSWDVHEGEVPGMGRMPLAGHVRACLDLVEQGMYGAAQGTRDQFLDNPATTDAFMRQVWKLRRRRGQWPAIDWFMGHEYYGQWLDFKDRAEQADEVASAESDIDSLPLRRRDGSHRR